MKMKTSAIRITVIALIASLALFAVASAGVISTIQSSTINKLSTTQVRGQILWEYSQDSVVTPGEEVLDQVWIENTGDTVMLARVKVDKVWGEGRDAKGRVVPDNSLDPDTIILDINTGDWLLDGDYLYYTDTIEVGNYSTNIFDSFIVDAGVNFDDYADKDADITIDLECVQATHDGVSYWGKTLAFLGIADPTYAEIKNSAQVRLVSMDTGFLFDAPAGDLFNSFKDLHAGESVSGTVAVKNELSIDAEITLQVNSSNKNSAIVKDFFTNYVNIIITDNAGNVLYNGPLMETDPPVVGNTLSAPLSLGLFSSDQVKNLNVNISIDSSADNDYTKLLGETEWVFAAKTETADPVDPPEPVEPTPVEPEKPAPPAPQVSSIMPKTGDTMNLVMFFIMGALAGTLIIVFAKRLRKDSKNNTTL